MIEKIPQEAKYQLLGEITSLMINSPIHLNYQIQDIVKNFLPPLDLDQFRIYKKGKTAVALITWAYLDDETQAKYSNLNEQYDLQADDWKKGKNLWFIDFIASQDVMKEIDHDMKYNLFPNEVARALRADETGKISHIQEYFGVNYKK